ncbi:MAG: hypothetical protein U9R25_01755 [Chloroflexota bacterium]|nr:hypothetical protein [Chloroflexota bacterium]
MKYNTKQIAIIAGSLILGFLVNWILWWLIMGHPTEIGALLHVLVTICLGTAFLLIADSLTNTEIFT